MDRSLMNISFGGFVVCQVWFCLGLDRGIDRCFCFCFGYRSCYLEPCCECVILYWVISEKLGIASYSLREVLIEIHVRSFRNILQCDPLHYAASLPCVQVENWYISTIKHLPTDSTYALINPTEEQNRHILLCQPPTSNKIKIHLFLYRNSYA